jgi:hypothetical protein
MTAAVGADVESLCSKCGDVWHVVVAKVGDKIAKVQCKQCHGFHRYKPPPGKEPKSLRPTTHAARAAKPTTTLAGGAAKKPTRAKKAAEPEAPAVQADLSRPVRRYSPAEAYTPGDRITHATFGAGVVELSAAGKIQVMFPGGRRVLAVAKAESTLGKPTNSPHD